MNSFPFLSFASPARPPAALVFRRQLCHAAAVAREVRARRERARVDRRSLRAVLD